MRHARASEFLGEILPKVPTFVTFAVCYGILRWSRCTVLAGNPPLLSIHTGTHLVNGLVCFVAAGLSVGREFGKSVMALASRRANDRKEKVE